MPSRPSNGDDGSRFDYTMKRRDELTEQENAAEAMLDPLLTALHGDGVLPGNGLWKPNAADTKGRQMSNENEHVKPTVRLPVSPMPPKQYRDVAEPQFKVRLVSARRIDHRTARTSISTGPTARSVASPDLCLESHTPGRYWRRPAHPVTPSERVNVMLKGMLYCPPEMSVALPLALV